MPPTRDFLRSFGDFGDELSLSELMRSMREIARAANLTVTPPLEMISHAGGNLLRVQRDHIDARIISGTNPYSWQQIDAILYTDTSFGASGTTTQNPAYERNGDPGVKAGTRVKLFKGKFDVTLGQQWEFHTPTPSVFNNSVTFNDTVTFNGPDYHYGPSYYYGGFIIVPVTITNPPDGVPINVGGVPKYSKLRISSASDISIPGFTNAVDGQILIIWNVSATKTITLQNLAGGAGQIVVPLGRNYNIWPLDGVILEYDGTSQVWRFDHPLLGTGTEATSYPTVYGTRHIVFGNGLDFADLGLGKVRVRVANPGGFTGDSGRNYNATPGGINTTWTDVVDVTLNTTGTYMLTGVLNAEIIGRSNGDNVQMRLQDVTNTATVTGTNHGCVESNLGGNASLIAQFGASTVNTLFAPAAAPATVKLQAILNTAPGTGTATYSPTLYGGSSTSSLSYMRVS